MRRVGDTYVHVFRHPLLKKVVSRGLGTDDESLAICIIDDIRLLCKQKELLANPEPAVLKNYKYKAVVCIFGEDRAKELLGGPPTVAARFRKVLDDDIDEATADALIDPDTDPNFDLDDEESLQRARAKALAKVGGAFEKSVVEDKVVENIQKRLDEKDERIVNLQRALDLTSEKLKRHEAESNVHVKASIETAIKTFLKGYEGRSDKQKSDLKRALHRFTEFLPKKNRTKIRDIRDTEIDAWIKSVEGMPLTKRRYKANLSTFCRWATKKYRLSRNPMDTADPVHGASSGRTAIKAFRAPNDITAQLDALKPWPYWHAWVTFAIFAGPRYNEQVHARVDKVYLEDGYLILPNFKTVGRSGAGAERRVPIEKTVLAPVLKTHLKNRLAQQKQGRTEGETSPWIFPSLADSSSAPVKRKKTLPGTWASGKLWHTHFDAVLQQAKGESEAEYWGSWQSLAGTNRASGEKRLVGYWGPDEWRHSFGTMLAMLGWNDMEISRVMGNSRAICERHYIAGTAFGPRARWKYAFE